MTSNEIEPKTNESDYLSEIDTEESTKSTKLKKLKQKRKIDKKFDKMANRKNVVDGMVTLLNALVDNTKNPKSLKTLDDLEQEESDTESLREEQLKLLEEADKKKSLREEKILKFKKIVENDQTKELVQTFGTQVIKPVYSLVSDLFMQNSFLPSMTKDLIPQLSNKFSRMFDEAREKRELQRMMRTEMYRQPRYNNKRVDSRMPQWRDQDNESDVSNEAPKYYRRREPHRYENSRDTMSRNDRSFRSL
jgi:hypothetical protein